MIPEFPNFSLEMGLSLEQEFTMKIFAESVQKMDSEDMRSLLLDASKLLMVKDNIIKGLMKKSL